MKKPLLFLMLLLLMKVAGAQDHQFTFGPKVGFTSNTLSYNIDSISNGLKTTLQAGIFLRFGRRVYFQPEVYYTVKGGKIDDDLGFSQGTQDLTLETLVVPLLFGVRLFHFNKFNMRLCGGPCASYVINKKVSTLHMGDAWPVQGTQDIKDHIFGLQAGAGMDIYFATLDVRYELGLNNIYAGMSSFDLKSNAVKVSLGIKLR